MNDRVWTGILLGVFTALPITIAGCQSKASTESEESSANLSLPGSQADKAIETLKSLGAEIDYKTIDGKKIPYILDLFVKNGQTITDKQIQIIRHLRTLEVLRLARIKMTGAGLSFLKGLPQIYYLSIVDMRLDPHSLQCISSLKNLRTLELVGKQITDETIMQLGSLPKLREFSLRATMVSGRGIQHIADIAPYLNYLSLAWCPRVNDDAISGLKALARLRFLRELDITGSPVGDAGMKYIASIPHILSLGASKTNITDRGLLILGKSRDLREISVRDCKISIHALDEMQRKYPHIKIITGRL